MAQLTRACITNFQHTPGLSVRNAASILLEMLTVSGMGNVNSSRTSVAHSFCFLPFSFADADPAPFSSNPAFALGGWPSG